VLVNLLHREVVDSQWATSRNRSFHNGGEKGTISQRFSEGTRGVAHVPSLKYSSDAYIVCTYIFTTSSKVFLPPLYS